MTEQPQCWNRDMERAILGAIILDNTRYFEAAADLSVDDFFHPDHRTIYRGIVGLMEAGTAVDYVSLCAQVQSVSRSITGSELISLGDGILPSSAAYYVAAVKELAQRRRVIALCQAAAQRAQDLGNLDEITGDVQNRLLDVMLDAGGKRSQKMKEILPAVFQNFNRFATWSLGEKHVGLSTGLPQLDQFLGGGYRRKEYYVWGGYTGDGKTSVAMMTILQAVAMAWPVLYFSHEMDRESVAHRLLAAVTNVRFDHLRDPRELEMFEYEDLNKTRVLMEEWPLWVEDSGSMEINQLRAIARMHIRRHKVAVVIVDYIQKVRAGGHTKRHEMISAVSEGLRELAKTENVAVIALSQLTQPEDKKKRAPRLFEYKESGDIVNDAHAVLAVYRPVNENGTFAGDDKIIVLKQRSGQVNIKLDVKYNSDRLVYEEKQWQHRDEG